MQDMQSPTWLVHDRHDSEEMLRAAQVGQLLSIDRSTVYRMAERGWLPARKIGRQWRFPSHEIDLLLSARPGRASGAPTSGREVMAAATRAALPMIELAAQMLGVMIVATDMDGEPVGEVLNPSPWFSEHAEEPELLATCLSDWKQLAHDPYLDISFRTGQLGLDCARTFVRQGTLLVGMLLAGGVAAADTEERAVYRLTSEGRGWVLSSLPIIAGRVSSLVAMEPASDSDMRSVTK